MGLEGSLTATSKTGSQLGVSRNLSGVGAIIACGDVVGGNTKAGGDGDRRPAWWVAAARQNGAGGKAQL